MGLASNNCVDYSGRRFVILSVAISTSFIKYRRISDIKFTRLITILSAVFACKCHVVIAYLVMQSMRWVACKDKDKVLLKMRFLHVSISRFNTRSKKVP